MMVKLRRLRVLYVVASGLVLASCAGTELAVHTVKQITTTPIARSTGRAQAGAKYKIGSPYQVSGVWYYPKADYTYRESGIASWYGPNFHGKRTANGEVYDQFALSAAHRTLPLPSVVRVTNLENGRAIKLRVNDRGPFANNRIIDLSRRAADLLGFRRNGTAKVLVEILENESRQVAALVRNQEATRNAPNRAPRVAVTTEVLPGSDGKVAATQVPTPARRQTAMASPRQTPARWWPQLVPPMSDELLATRPVQTSQIYVQAGSFARVENAVRLRARLISLGSANITQARVARQHFFRVRFGPLASVEAADDLLATLLYNGHSHARLVVE